jgi:alcohol dehydrogenase class IV
MNVGQPTDVAWDAEGNTYFSDGYVNSRVGKANSRGEWIASWGSFGRGEGQFNTPHGVAISLLLAHVVEWNNTVAGQQYDDLHAGNLVRRLRELADLAGLPHSLRDAAVPEAALPRLAEEAGAQWTGRFNPRPFDTQSALELYQCAY